MRYAYSQGFLNINKYPNNGYSYFRTKDQGVINSCGSPNNLAACYNTSNQPQRHFIKIDSTGLPVWERCYDDKDTTSKIVHDIFPVNDSLFIETFEIGASNWGMRKTRWDGSIVWENLYNIKCDLHFTISTDDGGYIMYGLATGTGGGNTEVYTHYGGPFNFDVFVFKVDSTGTKQWGKVLGGSFDEVVQNIIPTSDGGCLVVGNTQSDDYDATGHHGGAGMYSDLWIVKLDAGGNKLWHKCIGGSHIDQGYGMCKADDDGLFVVGNSRSSDGDVQGHVTPHGTTNIWILKIDSTGDIVWQRNYKNYLVTDIEVVGALRTIERDREGNLWCAGFSYHHDGYITDTVYNTSPGLIGDALVAQFDSLGNLIGRRVMGSPQDEVAMLALPLTNTVLVAGNYRPPATNNTLPSDTTSFPSVFLNSVASWSLSVKDTSDPGETVFEVFPNPTTGNVAVKANADGTVQITSSEGKIVYPSVKILKGKYLGLSLAHLAKGVYILNFQSENGNSSFEKIILK